MSPAPHSTLLHPSFFHLSFPYLFSIRMQFCQKLCKHSDNGMSCTVPLHPYILTPTCSLRPRFPHDLVRPLRALARTHPGPPLHNRKCFRTKPMWTLYLINTHTALPHPLHRFHKLPCTLQTIGSYTKECAKLYANTRPCTPFTLVQHPWLFEQQTYTLPCHSDFVSPSRRLLRGPWTARINSRFSIPNGC